MDSRAIALCADFSTQTIPWSLRSVYYWCFLAELLRKKKPKWKKNLYLLLICILHSQSKIKHLCLNRNCTKCWKRELCSNKREWNSNVNPYLKSAFRNTDLSRFIPEHIRFSNSLCLTVWKRNYKILIWFFQATFFHLHYRFFSE